MSLLGITSVAEVRIVDLDADGRPDLVAAGNGGIRTWINVGSGRFVEHAATRTILRRHTPPGFTTLQRSTPTTPAALVADRQALAPNPGAVDRAIVCTGASDIQSPPFASAEIIAGGSRAPPSRGRV